MDISNFDTVFPPSRPGEPPAYDMKSIERITRNRQHLEGRLFFDRLVRLLRIDRSAVKLYPPRSTQDLRALFDKLSASGAPEHYKQSLLFYLLLDCERAHASIASTFAKHVSLPPKYETYMRGLWALDNLLFKDALHYLTQPNLTPTFAEEILRTLVTQMRGDVSLPLSYYHSAVSSLAPTSGAMQLLFAALCGSSPAEAFFFSRQQAEAARRPLFEQLVAHVLGAEGGEARAAAGECLVGLPFDREEEAWFEEYLLRGVGKRLVGARDSVLVRRLLTGRFDAFLEGRVGQEVRADGVNWGSLKESLRICLGDRAELGRVGVLEG
ncbi:MAG: hypothetical protein M1829_005169 [Trizodia sp. TS-e1964]|nr:MAG: hypothetical protein M1829_005169 [Trizodia sp. TS-e1964]